MVGCQINLVKVIWYLLLKAMCIIAVSRLNYFRGISISPVISKLFQHVVLDRFSHLFVASDNQLGFKSISVVCTIHAMYNVRSVVNYYAQNSSTVNVCSLQK